MTRHWPLVAGAVAVLVGGSARAQQPIRGFPADALATQVKNEQFVRSVPNADTLRTQMRILSEDPHEAGTDRSRHVAELILARFRSYGLPARIERFEALMPRPVTRSLTLVAPDTFTATLKEPALPEDKDSGDADQLPTANFYSPDGDVTGDVVFVNYGVPADYKVLDSLGISVKGKIVIAKYGGSWRGIKPKVAAEHGAIGCLIYSDPKDDGYWVDDIYPKGPMRPWQGVQRGSVMDMPTYPGDPQSPGWASEAGARKLPMSEVKTIAPIPTLPISYGDALPILRALGGPVAPESWRGALPITYHVGGGPARVHLVLKFDWQVRPLYDVIAQIPGARSPDQWVLYGNHHDAWVNGAHDPISGQVALNEAARAIGKLLKTGWKPARTIIFAAWDGEEWGLLGSTEWAEKHADELSKSAVAYFGSDTNEQGWIGISGSHSLEEFARQLARDIPDPKRGKSVLAAVLERRGARRPQPRDTVTAAGHGATNDHLAAPADTAYTIGALGSGSDYTAYIDHLGIASLNISYGGGARSGIYHSAYDSFDFFTRFLDPDFTYGVLEAQTLGTAILRMADAPILPFEFGHAARTYRRYANEIEREANRNPATKGLDLSDVYAALDQLDAAAAHYERALAPLDRMSAADVRRRWKALAPINQMLYGTERALTDARGLEHREWFKHLLYAPGFYTGYGVKTMPGIREAVEDVPNKDVAQREAARIAAALHRYAGEVEKAATALEAALR